MIVRCWSGATAYMLPFRDCAHKAVVGECIWHSIPWNRRLFHHNDPVNCCATPWCFSRVRKPSNPQDAECNPRDSFLRVRLASAVSIVSLTPRLLSITCDFPTKRPVYYCWCSTEGPKALYMGLTASCLYGAPYVCLNMTLNTQTKKYMVDDAKDLTVPAALVTRVTYCSHVSS